MTTLVAALALVAAVPRLKTFGTGRSAFILTTNETTVFTYNLSSSATTGALTYFWETAGTQEAANNMTVRYYIDGEMEPSIDFQPPLAAGVGFENAAVWGTSKVGHDSTRGGWYSTIRVPFGSSIRITLSLPEGATSTTVWVIVRGCEELPISVGGVVIPAEARLTLQKISEVVYKPGQYVPLLDVPSGNGLLYMTTLAVGSKVAYFWEGCYHFYTPYDQPFPGVLLGTGMEDYFGSSFGFATDLYHNVVSGLTHKDLNANHTSISAYRFHDEDIVSFTNGARLLWRVGDYTNPHKYPDSPKCFIDEPGPGDVLIGPPNATTVTSYAWVYQWGQD